MPQASQQWTNMPRGHRCPHPAQVPGVPFTATRVCEHFALGPGWAASPTRFARYPPHPGRGHAGAVAGAPLALSRAALVPQRQPHASIWRCCRHTDRRAAGGTKATPTRLRLAFAPECGVCLCRHACLRALLRALLSRGFAAMSAACRILPRLSVGDRRLLAPPPAAAANCPLRRLRGAKCRQPAAPSRAAAGLIGALASEAARRPLRDARAQPRAAPRQAPRPQPLPLQLPPAVPPARRRTSGD